MKTRYRELYFSFLRLDNLKKITTTKTKEKKKEIQDEARRVGLLLKEYDSLRTEQGWSSARKSSGLSKTTPPAKEVQTTSLDAFDVGPRQEHKTNRNQVQETSDRGRDLRRHSFSLYNQRHCGQKSYDPTHGRTKCNTDEHVVANVARTQKRKVGTSRCLASGISSFEISGLWTAHQQSKCYCAHPSSAERTMK